MERKKHAIIRDWKTLKNALKQTRLMHCIGKILLGREEGGWGDYLEVAGLKSKIYVF